MELLFFLTLPIALCVGWGFVAVLREKHFLAGFPVAPIHTNLDTETHIYRTQEAYNHYDTGDYR
jgi:hypothetical protein